MKKAPYIIGILLILAILFWKRDSVAEAITGKAPDQTSKDRSETAHLRSDHTDLASTKSERTAHEKQEPEPVYHYTHEPSELKNFIIRDIEIQGVSLQAALEILKEKYLETCQITGERPLELVFEVPQGQTRPVHLNIKSKGLFDSIELVAAIAGAEMTRDNATFTFSLIEHSPVFVTDFKIGYRELESLGSALDYYFTDDETYLPPIDNFVNAIAPNNTISLHLAKVLSSQTSQKQFHIKTQSMRVDIPAGSDFQTPAQSPTSPEDMKLLQERILETIAEQAVITRPLDPDTWIGIQEYENGIRVQHIPSIISTDGALANVNATRGVNDNGGNEIGREGTSWEIIGVALGLGQVSTIELRDSQVNTDNTPVVETIRNSDEAPFSRNNQPQVHIETRSDGSRTIIITTQTRVNSLGQQIRVLGN